MPARTGAATARRTDPRRRDRGALQPPRRHEGRDRRHRHRATVSPIALAAGRARAQETSAFSFDEIEALVGENHAVAPGYDADILIRWGNPITADAPEFDPENQSAEAQLKQFGYNCDFLGTVPHPDAPDDHNRLLLVVHHEYTNEELHRATAGRTGRNSVGSRPSTIPPRAGRTSRTACRRGLRS